MELLRYATEDTFTPVERQRWEKEYEDAIAKMEAVAVRSSNSFTPEEIHLLTVMQNPKLWAAETLKWFARDYQEDMLWEMATSKRTVLRLGRRLGKTETMCIMILWHAFTQVNGDINTPGKYNILIIAPFDTQVDLIFDRLAQLIAGSGDINPSRDIEHRLELPNGTIITGLTAGSKAGNGAANTRGQRADLIVLDEADYMGESEITNILNIRNEAPERIKIIAASTPAGRRDSYYKWCTGATKTLSYSEELTEQTGRVMFETRYQEYRTNPDGTYKTLNNGKRIREGNGWTTIHAPSSVNPELLKVNSDTGLTYLEELQLDLTEMRYIQEVMAEFGESMSGVFLKKHIDTAIERGRLLNVSYAKKRGDIPKRGPRILGVDWDKSKADTNMVGVEWVAEHQAFIPFFRKSIPRGEFTYQNAINAIKEAHYDFDFDYMMIDAGHGENQIEQLKIWANSVEKGFGKRIKRVNFSAKVEVFDPITRAIEKKHIKPFMVENAVLIFEQGAIALNPKDKDMIRQFESYFVKKWGTDGRPVYTDIDEHILDCVVLALYGFTKYYSEALKAIKSTRILVMKQPLDRSMDPVGSRSLDKEKVKTSAIVSSLSSKRKSVVGNRGAQRASSRSGGYGIPQRKTF